MIVNNERRHDRHNNKNTDTITYNTMKRNTLPGKKNNNEIVGKKSRESSQQVNTISQITYKINTPNSNDDKQDVSQLNNYIDLINRNRAI